MKKFVEDFDNFDSISCEICLENYSNENPAIIIKCGHTICKNCLDSFIQRNKPLCSICKINYEPNEDKEKIMWENKIIDNLIELSKFLNINIDIFLSFPLNFKYCETCKFFITNYSFGAHKLAKHNLCSFNKKFHMFLKENYSFLLRKKTDSKNISEIENNEKYFIILIYFYQSPFLHKLKYFEVNKSIPFSNGEFKFYGQLLSHNENIFFSNLVRDNNNNDNLKWHKGALINKNIGLIIHGYFSFKIEGKKISLYHKIFGLFNYNEIKFFGFIDIKKENINDEEKLDINDFKFEFGLLYDKNYYFGQFDKDYFKIDHNNNDNKKLKKGEIITVKEKGVKIQRINFNDDLNSSIMIIEGKYEIQIIIKKITLNEHIIISTNNKLTNDKYDKCYLKECKIDISKFNITIRMPSKEDNTIIFLNSLSGKIENGTYYQEGYLILLNDKKLLDNLKAFTLKKIIDDVGEDNYEFIYKLNDLFETKIIDCKIKYCIFEIKNNEIKEQNEKYFEIFENEIKEIDTKNKRNKEKINKILHIEKINDLFSEQINNLFGCLIYPDTDKEQNINCCLTI